MNVQIDDVDFLVEVEVRGGDYEIPSSLNVHLGLEVLLDQTSVLQAVPSFSLSSLELFSQAFHQSVASPLHKSDRVLMRNTNVRVKAF